jgi:hypothetical protein
MGGPASLGFGVTHGRELISLFPIVDGKEPIIPTTWELAAGQWPNNLGDFYLEVDQGVHLKLVRFPKPLPEPH